MSNVLEIPVPAPAANSSVLEIPQVFGSEEPIVSTDQSGHVFQYGSEIFTDPDFVFTGATDCPEGTDEWLSIHEANTGWWFLLAHSDYHNPVIVDSIQPLIDAVVADHPTLGELFPTWVLTLAELDPEQLAVFDGWALFCTPLTVIPFVLCIPGAPFESCRPATSCPVGQARDGAGNCVVIDPPVPDLVPNLGEPKTSLNPTLRKGPPTPFAMKGCGCGLDDPEEITLDAARLASGTAGVSGAASQSALGTSNARMPGFHRARPRSAVTLHLVRPPAPDRLRSLSRGAPIPLGNNFPT